MIHQVNIVNLQDKPIINHPRNHGRLGEPLAWDRTIAHVCVAEQLQTPHLMRSQIRCVLNGKIRNAYALKAGEYGRATVSGEYAPKTASEDAKQYAKFQPHA
ncbi:hypothetical protein KIN20_030497 [Parelaphostrongylus tenuis]|uniref:Uncharacterized protein n=1 Tax=Parelaphostrongylus tenuis TaxID=148309 RepID=A0AAD5R3S3_PARTN|nr:hypothetical protein KIN20_030497 [Parelaphostrongylus tenuis]